MKVPGGSYSCAQAIVERRLLGYLQSAIAPHVHSQSKGRDECAVRQQVFVGASEVSHVRLVSWATARTCVMEFLAEAVRDGSSCLPCSNVKAAPSNELRARADRDHFELHEAHRTPAGREAQRQLDYAVAGAWAHGGARHRN